MLAHMAVKCRESQMNMLHVLTSRACVVWPLA